MRGAAFGLRQALDTVGAFLGPLLAMALMLLWANDFRAVFWVATIPAFLAVALLFFGVQEPERKTDGKRTNPIRRENLARLPIAYTPMVLIGMNAIYAVAAYPFGKLADSTNHSKLLAWGLVLLIAADACLAWSNHWSWVWAGITLAGLLWGSLGASTTFVAGLGFAGVALVALVLHRGDGGNVAEPYRHG